MGYLSHPYAWRLASASFAGATIERLQYRDTLDVVIRFADRRGRKFQPKALEIGEDELLVLIGDAIAAGAFSARFVAELRDCATGDVMTAKNVRLDRWIVVTVSGSGWVPHPSTGIFVSHADAQNCANNLVANGLAKPGSVAVKHIILSENV